MRKVILLVTALACLSGARLSTEAQQSPTAVLASARVYREAQAAAILQELRGWLRLPNVATNLDNKQHGPDENLRPGNFFQRIDIFAPTMLWE